MYVYKEKIRQSSFEPGSSAEMNGHGGEPAIHGYCSWYRYQREYSAQGACSTSQ